MDLKYEKIETDDLDDNIIDQLMEIEGIDGYNREEISNIWTTKRNGNFVCFDGEKVVGKISFNPLSKRRNGSIYIIDLGVLQSDKYLRKGIATNLIYYACKFYQDKQFGNLISLQVDKDNLRAINLYNKLGFEVKEPLCEADEDDEQYIMDTTIENIIQNIENKLKKGR